jgi:hypothetical protein
MNELVPVVLEAEPTLPMSIAGWGTLLLSVAVAVVWLAYLYR